MSNTPSKLLLSLVAFASLQPLLFADNISADNATFTSVLSSANDGDIITLDSNYSFVTNTQNVKNVFINGNGSSLGGGNAGSIFSTVLGGDFNGVSDITLRDGNSSSGGAISVDGDLKGGIYNSRLTDNYASEGGGAIYVYDDFEGNVSGSVFSNNKANEYGGAIAVAHDFKGAITNSTFSGNSVLGNNFGGGAILANTFSGAITDSVFSSNSAYMGGAIYTENANGIISDTNFTSNTARERGGAIYIYGTSNLTLHSSGSVLFSGNRDKSGSNAIYYHGYGGYYDGELKIITDDNATMEFRDVIADYGSGDSGKLSVDKDGNGTLIYNAAMTYRGETNINKGTLLLGTSGSVAGVLNIGDNATLSINKNYYYTLENNVNINSGTLDVNLNYINYLFSFANTTLQRNFRGTLILTNAYYNTLNYGNYSLVLNNNARAVVSNDNSFLKDVTLDGGTLALNVANPSAEPTLTVGELNIGENGGVVTFNTNVVGRNLSALNGTNLYDTLSTAYGTSYQILNATSGVNGNHSQLNITNVSANTNVATGNITQGSEVVGEAQYRAVGEVKNDGIYFRFGLYGVKSLTNVVLNSANATNHYFDIVLSGGGNFTFQGNNSAYVGNSASDYTGSTFIKDSTRITAISNNAFGRTNGLNLDVGAVFDLNSYSQSVYGLNNKGSILLGNGTLSAQGFLLNNGTIDLGERGSLTFNGTGASLGDDSLKGNGTIAFGGDFDINGTNDDLYARVVVTSGTTTLNHANSLGLYGDILTSNNSNIAFDISNNETLNKNINGNGSLVKLGNGTLTLNGTYTYMGLSDIAGGTLVSNISNFHNNISIRTGANLVLEQQSDHTFAYGLLGGGNVSQTGGYAIYLRGNSTDFTGIYHITDGILELDANDFGGNIDISSVSNLVLRQEDNSSFDGYLSGGGNITQLGEYILSVNSNNSNFIGNYDIQEGTLQVNSLDNLANANSITIANGATYAVNSTSNETLRNDLFGFGVLAVDLNNTDNFFSFATSAADNFFGVLSLSNASFVLKRDLSNLSLTLNGGSWAYINNDNSTIKNLTFDGGTLDLNTTSIALSPEVILTVEELNMGGEGGSIVINANASSLGGNVTAGLNLYDYSNLSNSYQILNATNGVNGVGAQLDIVNNSYNSTYMSIVQNSSTVGEATFGTVAQLQADGIYIGFGLQRINAFGDVVLDGGSAANNTLGAVLSGNGSFTFTGDREVHVGNANSNYTGSTTLRDSAHVVALSDNAFGETSSLALENSTTFDLNSYYQFVNGSLSNDGEILLNNGWLDIQGYTSNHGTINLGDDGKLDFGEGTSVGDDSLVGGGAISFYGDFNISGRNDALNASVSIHNGTLALDNAVALGSGSYIYVLDDAAIDFDISGNETLDKEVYSYGSLIKRGNGTLALEQYTYVSLANILDGVLIVDASSFYGNVNISSSANLIFNNSADAEFYDQLLGEGNVTQKGNHTLLMYSDNSNFTGTYNVNEGTLLLDIYAVLGGDVAVNDATLLSEGKILGGVLLNNSIWRLSDNADITSLALSNSSVYLGNQADNFSASPAITLTLNELSGNGNFYQRLDIKQSGENVINNGDLIVINNSSSGNHALYFNDRSTGNISLSGDEGLLVVRQNSTSGDYKANFTGQIDLGEFTYTLVQNSPTDKNIYLKSGICSNAACASMSFPSINYVLNYIDTDTLLQRMGEVNLGRSDKDDIWIKTYGGKLGSFKDEFRVDGVNYYGFNMGIDITQNNGLLGLVLGYSSADIDYTVGDANSKSYDIGAYFVVKSEEDFYLNSILKYRINKNSFNTQTSNGFAVEGKGDTSDILFSVEGGKRYDIANYPFYVEPQAQVTLSRQGSFDVTSSNGLQTKIDSFKSIRARLGAIFGYRLKNTANVYLKAGYIKEFKDEATYSFNNGEKQTYEINGNFFDSAIGITSNIDNHSLYFEGGYQIGDMFDNIKANLGYRYSF